MGCAWGLSCFSCVCIFVTLWTPGSLPGSSVRGIFQIGLLEWVAMTFSRGSSWPRDWIWRAWRQSAWWYSMKKTKMMIVIILLQFSISLGTYLPLLLSLPPRLWLRVILSLIVLQHAQTLSSSSLLLPLFSKTRHSSKHLRYLYSRSPV